MFIRTVAIAGLGLAATACASWDSAGIAYNDDSKLFVWRSNYSAGMGTSDGICAQAATTMQANNTQVDVQASDAVLGLINPATLTSAQSSELIDLGVAQTQTIGTTNVSNGQTAFANIAFFYLCQISLNGQLEDATIAEMWESTNETLGSIGNVGTVGSIRADPVEGADD